MIYPCADLPTLVLHVLVASVAIAQVSTTRRDPRLVLLFFAWAFVTGPASVAQESSSTSYVLSQSTVNNGGGTSTSGSFVLDGSIAQPAAVDEATSSSYVLQSGFWTSLSTRVVLRVEGSGSGAGVATGGMIACMLDAGSATGTCRESFARGSTVDLVAAPDAGNRFDAWTGCDSTSTTDVTDDTCRVLLRRETNVSAAFTALATVGDRVWRDVDGDGVQDAGEPGLGGVRVMIDDGDGTSGSVVTAGDGTYTFLDVPPGTYRLSVDDATLPIGTTPSFDPDGIVTPHGATIALIDGETRDTADFGYQPQTNLAITLADSEDPLPGGDTLVYTITVQNLGPGIATGIEVDASTPVGSSLVATSGCVEDPAASPTCSLGVLDAGSTANFTLEVAIDPAPPASITATATVASVEVDLDTVDNSASETTGLDDDPPSTAGVSAYPPTADGVLSECETVHNTLVSTLNVTFDEAIFDPVGDTTSGDVTNPASWRLIAAGHDAQFDTITCGALAGDDVAVGIEAVTFDAGSRTARLDVGGLDASVLRLFACGIGDGALRDLGGTALDGDGDGLAGGDFVRQFRTDPDNLFADGSLDCDLGVWTVVSDEPSEVHHSTDDVDDSAESGSVAIDVPASDHAHTLGQCVAVDDAFALDASARLRLATDALMVDWQWRCTFFDQGGCGGARLGTDHETFGVAGTAGAWDRVAWTVQPPSGTASALCRFTLTDAAGLGFDARIDDIALTPLRSIFADGFETGNTVRWGTVVP